MSKQSVTNWTQGKHEPSLLYLRRLSRVLRVPVAALLEQDDAKSKKGSSDASVLDALAKLRSPLEGLARSTPELLDLLTEAEREARRLS